MAKRKTKPDKTASLVTKIVNAPIRQTKATTKAKSKPIFKKRTH